MTEVRVPFAPVAGRPPEDRTVRHATSQTDNGEGPSPETTPCATGSQQYHFSGLNSPANASAHSAIVSDIFLGWVWPGAVRLRHCIIGPASLRTQGRYVTASAWGTIVRGWWGLPWGMG